MALGRPPLIKYALAPALPSQSIRLPHILISTVQRSSTYKSTNQPSSRRAADEMSFPLYPDDASKSPIGGNHTTLSESRDPAPQADPFDFVDSDASLAMGEPGSDAEPVTKGETARARARCCDPQLDLGPIPQYRQACERSRASFVISESTLPSTTPRGPAHLPSPSNSYHIPPSFVRPPTGDLHAPVSEVAVSVLIDDRATGSCGQNSVSRQP